MAETYDFGPNNLVGTGHLWKPNINAGNPLPTISSVAVAGGVITIQGTNFGANQLSGFVNFVQDEAVLSAAVLTWANLEITVTEPIIESSILRYGSPNAVVTNGFGDSASEATAFNPVAPREAIDIINPIVFDAGNPTSIAFLVSGSDRLPADNDQAAYDPQVFIVGGAAAVGFTISVNADLSYSIIGDGDLPIGEYEFRNVRAFDNVLNVWGSLGSIPLASAVPSANTAPVVTAPIDTPISFLNGAGGLALDDAQLVALFATATVVDDSDTLTVSPDLTAFTGSIPAGPHTIQFNSTADSEGLTGSDTMLLTITEASAGNNAPSITSASTVAVTVDVSANHMVTTNDIDGDALTIVTVGSLPAGYALVDNGNGTATVTIVAPSEGAQNITVRVSDGSLSADQVITVNATVAGNNPPTFTNNPPTVATVGSLYSFTPATNDIDGDAVVLTSTTLPSWLTLVGGVLSGTPADGDIGANPVVLSGSDGVDSTPLSFSVLVGNVLPFVFAPLGRVIVFDDSQREKHQDPDAFLDYWCCFSNLIGGDLIVSHQVIVPEGILVDIHSINTIPLTDSDGVVHAVGTVIVLWVSGGSAGTPYKITVRFTTASGRIDDRSIVIHSVDK